jgi:hypothetical protein
MNQSIEDAERKLFEAAYREEYSYRGDKENDFYLRRNSLHPEKYYELCAVHGWNIWKLARQSSQSEPVGRVVHRKDTTQYGMLYTHLPEGTNLFLAAPQQAIPSGWISVDDTLPSNPEERVLAMETDGEVYRLYYRDGKWLDIDGYELLAVHAWMEFPEMYDLSASPTAPIERDK